MVGTSGPALRAPAVLEWGELWMLEQSVVSEPFEGPPAVDAALTASAALARLRLPAPPGAHQNPLLGTASALAYRVRALKPPLPPSDLARARRMLHRTSLPLRTGHGDFHRDNLLLCDGVVWAVDWELSGLLPAGFDLCVLWASLDDPTDRDRLFEGAVAQVGEEARRDLAVLRYSLTVRTIASKLASPLPDNRDREGAAALVELLPALRAEAGVSTARP
ncbi:MAG: aminoglycoside phosphotransferase family protein [Actinomycetota bacterium]|nr:aminoglycoside phosphotransferase family protein [Actinomycetota bacterium]